MATRRQFIKVVESFNASWDEQPDDYDLIIDAPKGKVWAEGGDLHYLVIPFRNISGQSWKPEAYDDAIDRMNYGLEDCSREDCEHCTESE